MPTHDWTRVPAGTFHDFHLAWIAEIRNVLNDGILPSDYYAQAEQIAGPMGPDVLTLQSPDLPSNGKPVTAGEGGGVAVALPPPRTRWTAQGEMDDYVLKRRTIVIRHVSGDRIVALIEIVSPGNKASANAFRTFVEKATEALYRGYHLMIVDLFQPGRRDRRRIHGAIWESVGEHVLEFPADEPITLATYSAGLIKQAFVETSAVAKELPDMALFLEPEFYVNVPLQATYEAAYRGVPRKWKAVLEGAAQG